MVRLHQGGIVSLLRRATQATPDDAAFLLTSGGRISFGEWWAEAVEAASAFEAARLADARVGLRPDAGDWREYCVSFFGLLLAGATPVTLSTSLSAPQMAEVSAGLRLSARVDAGRLVPLDQQPAANDRWRSAREASILLTSGTSGRVRAVLMPHDNLIDSVAAAKATDGVRRRLMYVPTIGTHLAQVALLRPLSGDATAVIATDSGPSAVLAALVQTQATDLTATPSLARHLTTNSRHLGERLPHLQTITLTGDVAVPAVLTAVHARFPHAKLRNFYTSTEAYPAAISTLYDPAKPRALGFPDYSRATIAIGHPSARRPAGTPGTVWLKAKQVGSRQIIEGPDWIPRDLSGGWVDTGDHGYLDEDGALVLVDRESDLAVVHGTRTNTRDAENALLGLAGIDDAAVVVLRDRFDAQYLAAAVVSRDPSRDPRALRGELLRVLPPLAVPTRIVLVSSITRNDGGKVDKRQLRRVFGQHGASDETPPFVDDLTRIWQHVLGLDDGVTRNSDFVQLGGDSLALEELCVCVEEQFGVSLDPEDLVTCRDLSEMAQLLRWTMEGARAHQGKRT